MNRILLTYGESGDVVLSGKGSGGLTEMKTQMNSNQVYFGVARVRAVDDHGSKRAKFIFITFVGPGVVSTAECLRTGVYHGMRTSILASITSRSCFNA